METLIRRLWPLVKPRVTALIAAQLIRLAARGHVTLGQDEAIALAVLIVAQVEDLLVQDDANPALTKAIVAFAQTAIEPVSTVATVAKKRKR